MDIATRVGLQLLLEPSSSAHVFRGLSVGAGTLYPAYQTYKAVHMGAQQDPRGDVRSRWLKYWAVFGALSVTERALMLDKIAVYPHIKLAFLVWLQLHNNERASWLFDTYMAPFLARYEVKVDICLQQGLQILEALYQVYRIPISSLIAAGKQALQFVQWFLEPSPQQQGNGGSSRRQDRAGINNSSSSADSSRDRQERQLPSR